MGLENIRGGYGRCPPFLVGSLIIICFILTFNWWSLSAQNYDIIKQLEDLGDQLKLTSDELERCDHQRGALESRNKNNEDELARLTVRYEQAHSDAEIYKNKLKESQNKLDASLKEMEEIKRQNMNKDEELKTANNDKEDIQNNVNMCETELASLKKLDVSKNTTIKALRIEIEKYKTELEDQKKYYEKMNENLNTMKKELEDNNKIKPLEIKLETTTKSDPQNNIIEGINHDVENRENNAAERNDPLNDIQPDLLNDQLDNSNTQEPIFHNK